MSGAVALFEALNAWVRPLALMGLGSPTPIHPSGLVVVEVAGRKSGLTRQLPVLGLLVPGGVLVSTLRQDSEWLKNLAAAECAHLWLWGRRLPVTPAVIRAGDSAPDAVPAWLGPLVARAARELGLNVAWLGFDSAANPDSAEATATA